MRIGELAKIAGVTIDTIRFYEKRGLLGKRHFSRGENGYRIYNESAVEYLSMIQKAQLAGFTLKEIDALLSLWTRGKLSDGMILDRLQEKERQIAEKIVQLQELQSYLSDKILKIQPTPP
jgi:DNA-binding transcriptional MerR regulator